MPSHQKSGAGNPAFRHGHCARTNGRSWQTPTYRAWRSMRRRCHDEKHPAYGDYGGRGITVCERWASFENFLGDMGECPTGLTLERRDNSLGYSAGNCYWATTKQQSNNRRSNTIVEVDGVKRTLAQWADAQGLPRSAIYARIKKGWDPVRAVTAPIHRRER